MNSDFDHLVAQIATASRWDTETYPAAYQAIKEHQSMPAQSPASVMPSSEFTRLVFAGSRACALAIQVINSDADKMTKDMAMAVLQDWGIHLKPVEPEPNAPESGYGNPCPSCGSPEPRLYPAVQFEGEVRICSDPYHGPPPSTQVAQEPTAGL